MSNVPRIIKILEAHTNSNEINVGNLKFKWWYGLKVIDIIWSFEQCITISVVDYRGQIIKGTHCLIIPECSHILENINKHNIFNLNLWGRFREACDREGMLHYD